MHNSLIGSGTSKSGWPIERLTASLIVAARSKILRIPAASSPATRCASIALQCMAETLAASALFRNYAFVVPVRALNPTKKTVADLPAPKRIATTPNFLSIFPLDFSKVDSLYIVKAREYEVIETTEAA